MIAFIKNTLHFFNGLIYLFFYYVSFLFHRDSNIWLFGSYRNTYSDNSRAFFEYVTRNKPEIKAIWITGSNATVRSIRSRGFIAFNRYSPLGIFYSLKGLNIFYNMYINDVSLLAANNTYKYNLWHGIGLKKIEFSVESGKVYEMLHYNSFVQKVIKKTTYFYKFIKPDYFISTTDFQSIPFSKAFRISLNKCLNIGTPRTDIFFLPKEDILKSKADKKDAYFVKHITSHAKYNKIFIYLPTWRDTGYDFVLMAGLDFTKINRELIKHNSLLILKFHFNTKNTTLKNIKSLSNIVMYDNNIDLYSFLPFTDVLITDYSSVYYDYLLLNKPTILFVFDIDKYTSDSRAFNYNFNKYTGCHKAYNISEFMNIFKKELKKDTNQKNIECKIRTEELISTFWGAYQGNASKKLYEFTIKNSNNT